LPRSYDYSPRRRRRRKIYSYSIEKRARKCRPFVFPLTLKKIKKNLVPTGTASPLTLNPTTYNLNNTHREEEEEDTLTSEPVLARAQQKSQKVLSIMLFIRLRGGTSRPSRPLH
jgi:hypothetical protein